MKRAPGETISGVTYRCKECGANLGDPEEQRDYVNWAAAVRVHMAQRHFYTGNREVAQGKALNDLVAALFVWTTPTGHEVVTTGSAR